MPVSVNAVLRDSLAGSSDHGHHQQLLQTQIASATKHLVLKNVEYEEYPENFLAKNDALKKKYILLSDKSSNGCSPKKTLASPAAQNGSNGLGKYLNIAFLHAENGPRSEVRLCVPPTTTTEGLTSIYQNIYTYPFDIGGLSLQTTLPRTEPMDPRHRRQTHRRRTTKMNCHCQNERFFRAIKFKLDGRVAIASGKLARVSSMWATLATSTPRCKHCCMCPPWPTG